MDTDALAPPIPDEADRMLIAPQGPIDGRIQVPPSKSLTIRALAAAALAGGKSALRDPLFSDDTLLMARALQALGIEVQRGETSMLVEGRAGTLPAPGASRPAVLRRHPPDGAGAAGAGDRGAAR